MTHYGRSRPSIFSQLSSKNLPFQEVSLKVFYASKIFRRFPCWGPPLPSFLQLFTYIFSVQMNLVKIILSRKLQPFIYSLKSTLLFQGFYIWVWETRKWYLTSIRYPKMLSLWPDFSFVFLQQPSKNFPFKKSLTRSSMSPKYLEDFPVVGLFFLNLSNYFPIFFR